MLCQSSFLSTAGADPPAVEQAPEPAPDAVRAQLEKILLSNIFARSQRISRFLRFTVEQTLLGRGGSLKEYLIATEVYDKPDTMDPRFDPIVRVEAGRLRSKLREYYEAEGRDDAVVISFRKRSYAPVFIERQTRQPDAHTAEAQSAGQPEGMEINSIAVLPFADMSRRRDQDHFCDGLTEELINALAHVEGLRVVARTSVFQFKGQAGDIRKIGQELNVSSVLEGSVRKYGHRLRITAQLNSAADGYHLWSETFDRETRDIFGLQEEISRIIASKLAMPSRGSARAN